MNAQEILAKRRLPQTLTDNTVKTGETAPPSQIEENPMPLGTEVYGRPQEPMPDAVQDAPQEMSAVTPVYNPEIPNEQDAALANMQQQIVSPYFEQIKQNQANIDALRTMPVTDADGRTKSGIKAFFEAIRRNPNMARSRSWGDLGANLAFAVGGGISGAVNPTWNEEEKRLKQIAILQQQQQELQKNAQVESNALYKQAQYELGVQKEERMAQKQTEDLALRDAQFKYKRLNDRAKSTLSAVLASKRYKAGENEETDDLLAEAGIFISDFDNRPKKYITRNGATYEVDADGVTQKVDGIPDDTTEQPMEFLWGGQRMMLKPRQAAQIIANAEAQKDRQNFQSTENEKQRNFTAQQNELARQHQVRLKAIEEESRIKVADHNNALKRGDMELANKLKEEIANIQQRIKQENAEFIKSLNQK